MTLQEMRSKRADLLDERKKLHEQATAETRDFTAEEQTKFDDLKAEAEVWERRIKTAETIDAEQEELGSTSTARPTTRPGIRVEDNFLKDPNKGFKSLGDFCEQLRRDEVGVETSEQFRRWKNVGTNPEFYNQFAAGTGGMIAGIASEGGALVPGGFVGTLLEKPMKESPLLNGLMSIPITSGNTIEIPYINESSRVDGSRQGGVRVYRDAELEALTQSKPAFGKLKLTANAMTGLCYVSNDMLKFSAISVEPLITRMFQREFAWQIQDELLNGNGGQELLGILNSNCLVSQAKETGQAAATIVWNNIIKMWSRRHVASGPYVWVINQDCLPQMASMTMDVGTGGVPVWMPAGGAAGLPYSTLMGAPVIEAEQAQTVGTAGDIYLIAPGEYIYGVVPGMDADASIHLKFDYRQTAFRFVMFNCGAPWWSSALTPYKGGSTKTQSPFINLAVRA